LRRRKKMAQSRPKNKQGGGGVKEEKALGQKRATKRGGKGGVEFVGEQEGSESCRKKRVQKIIDKEFWANNKSAKTW